MLTAGLLLSTPGVALAACTPKVTKAWATKTVTVGPTYQVSAPLRARTYDECARITDLTISWRRSGHYDYADLRHLSGGVPTETWGKSAAIDPYLLTNTAAGKHTIDVEWISDADYSYDTEQINVGSFYIKRRTALSVNASPEPVRKGRTITVTGKLKRADWDWNEWRNYGGQYVKLQFKKPGGSYYTLTSVKANSYGNLKAYRTANVDGTYRWYFPGNGTSGAKASSGDYIDVR